MSPDVGSLGVYAKDALETGAEARKRGTVTEYEEVVVLEPGGEVVKVAVVPSHLNEFPDDLFGLTGGVMCKRRNVQLIPYKFRWVEQKGLSQHLEHSSSLSYRIPSVIASVFENNRRGSRNYIFTKQISIFSN